MGDQQLCGKVTLSFIFLCIRERYFNKLRSSFQALGTFTVFLPTFFSTTLYIVLGLNLCYITLY